MTVIYIITAAVLELTCTFCRVVLNGNLKRFFTFFKTLAELNEELWVMYPSSLVLELARFSIFVW